MELYQIPTKIKIFSAKTICAQQKTIFVDIHTLTLIV